MTTIELTTIGSCGLLDVAPAALPEARGGVTLWFSWNTGGELAVTLTADEARALAAAIPGQLALIRAWEATTP